MQRSVLNCDLDEYDMGCCRPQLTRAKYMAVYCDKSRPDSRYGRSGFRVFREAPCK